MQRHILVAGDYLYEKYTYGHVRNRPGDPIPVFTVNRTHWKPGGCGHVTEIVKQHAKHTTLCTAITGLLELPTAESDDGSERFQLVKLPGKTVDTVKETIINEGAQSKHKMYMRVDHERYEAIDLSGVDTDTFHAVILSDYNKGLLHDPSALIANAKCPVFVDVYAGTDWNRYSGAFCLKPNRRAFEVEAGGQVTLSAARTILHKYAVHALVITLDHEGVWWVTEDEDIRLPGFACGELVDSLGAGDTFIAILAMYFDSDKVRMSLELANRAAAYSTTKFGTYVVTRDDIMKLSSDLPSEIDEICDLPHALGPFDGQDSQTGPVNSGMLSCGQEPEESKDGNTRRVVFTNGCFDMLHVQHVLVLQYARSLGTELVVGLNSDASVERIKRRPIMSEQNRRRMLESLSCVDRVEIFDEDTPVELIRRIRPDILVKGGDYAGRESSLAGHELVRQVVIMPTPEGGPLMTTTQIISTILSRRKDLEKGLTDSKNTLKSKRLIPII